MGSGTMRLLRLLRRIHYALINGDGRWIAWIIYAQALPSYGMPSYRQLRFNTRYLGVDVVDEDEFEDTSLGLNVQIQLVEYTAKRWFGRPIKVYVTNTYMQIRLGINRPHFERSRGFPEMAAARADFLKMSRRPSPAPVEELQPVKEEA